MREREGAVIYDDFQFNYREAAIGRDSYMQSSIRRCIQTSVCVSKLHINYGSFIMHTKCLFIKQSDYVGRSRCTSLKDSFIYPLFNSVIY